MEFMIQPIELPVELGQMKPGDNGFCPANVYQCGCNTIQGCACPKP